MSLIPGASQEGGLANAASAALTTTENAQPTASPIEAILKIFSQVKGQSNIPGTVMGSTPTAAPLNKPERSPITTDSREFRTSSGNKRVAFNNMMQNITGMVTTAAKNEENKKARALSLDMERLFNAQAGLEQAKQNPNDPQSKEAIARNTQIINDIMGDPKKRKDLEKAFNFNILGNDKDQNSWQRKAFTESAKKYQTAQKSGQPELNPYADLFMRQQPEQLKANPAMQAQIEAAKAGLIPTAKEQLDLAGKLITEMGREKAAQVLGEERVKAAEVTATKRSEDTLARVEGMKAVAQKNYDKAVEVQKLRNSGKSGSGAESKQLNGLVNLMKMNLKDIDDIQEKIKANTHWYGNSKEVKQLEQKLKILQLRQSLMDKRAGTILGDAALSNAIDAASDKSDDDMKDIDKMFGDTDSSDSSEE